MKNHVTLKTGVMMINSGINDTSTIYSHRKQTIHTGVLLHCFTVFMIKLVSRRDSLRNITTSHDPNLLNASVRVCVCVVYSAVIDL